MVLYWPIVDEGVLLLLGYEVASCFWAFIGGPSSCEGEGRASSDLARDS